MASPPRWQLWVIPILVKKVWDPVVEISTTVLGSWWEDSISCTTDKKYFVPLTSAKKPFNDSLVRMWTLYIFLHFTPSSLIRGGIDEREQTLPDCMHRAKIPYASSSETVIALVVPLRAWPPPST